MASDEGAGEGGAALSRITALEPETLAVRWRAPLESQATASGAALLGQTVHVGFENFLAGFALGDGTERYRAPISVGYPLAHEGALLADADGQLRRIDPTTLEYAWSVGSEVMGRPVVVEDVVAVPTTNGILAASVGDGQERWTRTLEEGTGYQPETLAYHGGILWYGAADETLYGLLPESGETAFSMAADVRWVASSAEGVAVAADNTVTVYTVEA